MIVLIVKMVRLSVGQTLKCDMRITNHKRLHFVDKANEVTDREKKLFTNFLRANKDVFAWSAEDMHGIDPSVICHRLH